MSTPSLQTAALDYLAHALAPIALHTPIVREGCSCREGRACLPPGKHLRPEWEDLQTRRATVAEVRAWWIGWPDANVGIITGMVTSSTPSGP